VEALGAVAPGETAPTGVQRMQAVSGGNARNASTLNVAVIDTGVDLSHPDLNAVAGKNCVTPGAAPNDDNGHGSHVAGTIGALNTGAGVLGVAPGTRIFAAKVLNSSGSGSASQVICGIDWVTSTRTDSDPTNDISVANMSLGGGGPVPKPCATETDPEHKAICNSVAAGVTYVVAAGNSSAAFDSTSSPSVPADYPEVLTVTAVSDSEGVAGGTGGAPTCRTGEGDDRYASFSNWAATAAGQAHTIAAPGVCIRSTWMNGGYNTISGTSMASPHMAGAVALCLSEGPCAGLTPDQVIAKMRADASQTTTDNPWFGFGGDPLHAPLAGRYYGYLAYAGVGAPVPPSSTPPPPPPPAPSPNAVSAAPASASITSGSLRSGSLASLTSDDSSWLQVSSTTSGTRTAAWYGTFTSVPSALSALKVTFKGKASKTATQTVSIYRWSDGAWVTLDTRTLGTTDTLIADRSPSGALASYVSSAGQVRVRVSCTRKDNFSAAGNLLRLTYTAAQ
jgi:subtilisin family serine protease